jgi:hypothetical protein
MHDDRVQALLTPTVVSHLLGAFELNCVGITVESPVEDLLEEVKTAVRRAAGGGSSTQRAILEVCSLPPMHAHPVVLRLQLCCGTNGTVPPEQMVSQHQVDSAAVA